MTETRTQWSLLELKPGLVFNAPLFNFEEFADFFIPSKTPIERKHHHMMIQQGVDSLFTEGIVIENLGLSIYERISKLEALIHSLEADRNTFQAPASIDYHAFEPAIAAWSSYERNYTYFQQLILTNMLPNARVEVFKKKMDRFIRQMYHEVDQLKSFYIKALVYLPMEHPFFSQAYQTLLWGLILTKACNFTYQYIHYWAQSHVVLTFGNLLGLETMQNPMVSKILSPYLKPSKLDQVLMISKHYFKYGGYVDRILQLSNRYHENPEKSRSVYLVNVFEAIRRILKALKKSEYMGFKESLPHIQHDLGTHPSQEVKSYLKKWILLFVPTTT